MEWRWTVNSSPLIHHNRSTGINPSQSVRRIRLYEAPTQLSRSVRRIGFYKAPTQLSRSVRRIGFYKAPTQLSQSVRRIRLYEAPTQLSRSVRRIGFYKAPTQLRHLFFEAPLHRVNAGNSTRKVDICPQLYLCRQHSIRSKLDGDRV